MMNSQKGTQKMNHKRKKRNLFVLLLTAVLLFQPLTGLTVRAEGGQNGAASQSAQEAADAAQAQADALMAAHLAAWQQAQAEYAAQLAAYQQALAQQQAEAAAQAVARQQALMEQQAQAAAQQAAEEPTVAAPVTSFAGKTVSILGDSISTYQG